MLVNRSDLGALLEEGDRSFAACAQYGDMKRSPTGTALVEDGGHN